MIIFYEAKWNAKNWHDKLFKRWIIIIIILNSMQYNLSSITIDGEFSLI